jgi:oligopeptide transport system permease protein
MALATAAPAQAIIAPQRLRLSRLVWASAIFLGLVALGAIFVPLLFPAADGRPSPNQFLPPGSPGHVLGTDFNGRDLLFRIFTGARISLLVGLAGAFVSLFVGTTYGIVAGYSGGRLDNFMMRVVDVFYAVPRLIFILLLAYIIEEPMRRWLYATFSGTFFGGVAAYPKIVILIIALGMIEWLTMARIVRGQVLALKSLPFVTAARALGQTRWKIVTRHLLPNLAGIIIVYLTLTVPAVMLDEAFLSFLGLGVDASQASWGTLLSDGAQVINPIKSYWWLLVFPAVLMSFTLLALNFLGDGLHDAFDPRRRER